MFKQFRSSSISTMYRGSNTNRGGCRGGRGRGGSKRGAPRGPGGSSRGSYHGISWRDSIGAAAPSSETISIVAPSTAAAGGAGKRGPNRPNLNLAQIFRFFNPSSTDFKPGTVSTLNPSEEFPDGLAVALVYLDDQPRWMSEDIIYADSRLDLLPEYQEQRSLVDRQQTEPTPEDLMARITAELTESIDFKRYGLEDGPDMEVFDEDDNIQAMVVPGEWMQKSHELPELARVDTPSIKYAPTRKQAVAVYMNSSVKSGFKFIAWFAIEEVELFAAKSVDLVRNMQEKNWEGDIEHDWAAIKLRKIKRNEAEWRSFPRVVRSNSQTIVSLNARSGEPEDRKNGDHNIASNSALDADDRKKTELAMSAGLEANGGEAKQYSNTGQDVATEVPCKDGQDSIHLNEGTELARSTMLQARKGDSQHLETLDEYVETVTSESRDACGDNGEHTIEKSLGPETKEADAEGLENPDRDVAGKVSLEKDEDASLEKKDVEVAVATDNEKAEVVNSTSVRDKEGSAKHPMSDGQDQDKAASQQAIKQACRDDEKTEVVAVKQEDEGKDAGDLGMNEVKKEMKKGQEEDTKHDINIAKEKEVEAKKEVGEAVDMRVKEDQEKDMKAEIKVEETELKLECEVGPKEGVGMNSKREALLSLKEEADLKGVVEDGEEKCSSDGLAGALAANKDASEEKIGEGTEAGV
ncbi:hypothetical protein VTI74DRAFT_6945 [Chaetomium olivicolor]